MIRRLQFLVALAMVLSMSLAGCLGSKEVKSSLASTGEAPGASGIIASKSTDDGNTKFQVKVENLAAPYEVENGMRTYVVWVKPLDTDDPPQKIGIMMPGNDLRAKIDGITPYKNFELFVTAETSATPPAPSMTRVLSGMVRLGA